ncbi:MAG: hypothetical protein ABSB12_01450 [Candidatus Saccharimonadales bacterium]|jgi:hypothetical protein
MAQLLSNEQISTDSKELYIKLEADDDEVQIEEMPGADGLFNVAAWEYVEDLDADGTIRRERVVCLLGRGPIITAGDGLPDVTPLIYRELAPSGQVKFSETVYEPEEGKDILEDPRVLLREGKLIIGLTSVVKTGEKYIPHPAIVVTNHKKIAEGLQRPKIVTNPRGNNQIASMDDNAVGKNTTVIDETTYMYRPEGTENDHRLRIFKLNDDEISIQQNDIELPNNIPWATYRTGTTMPPVWLNDFEAIFPIHGIRIDQNGIFEYAIGSARLVRGKDGMLSIDNISREPLIYPDFFVGRFDADIVELHPEIRRVVYCVSGRPVYDERGNLQTLEMLVNVGDTRTLKVTIPIFKLTEGWQSSREFTPFHILSDVA